jgi:acyl-CoA hydrolase
MLDQLQYSATEEQRTDPSFSQPASEASLEKTAQALRAAGFDVEILDDVAAARARVRSLVPAGATVFTAASETLRLGGIDDELNKSGKYDSVKTKAFALNRATQMPEIRKMTSVPDIVVGSVTAITEDGSLVAVSASGSQLPAYAGGAQRAIFVVGSQKIVPDLATALTRIEKYATPLEDARARVAYGRGTAINKILIINGAGFGPSITVFLLREAIGY